IPLRFRPPDAEFFRTPASPGDRFRSRRQEEPGDPRLTPPWASAARRQAAPTPSPSPDLRGGESLRAAIYCSPLPVLGEGPGYPRSGWMGAGVVVHGKDAFAGRLISHASRYDCRSTRIAV